jgi:dTDP-4-amino-4,6-dideoxygalactose transaminase
MSDVERDFLLEAFDSNWIAPLGPQVDAFESEVAEYVGVAHALALSSGTAGLHLAMVALGVGPGDHVLVPTQTFVATANAVRYVGATPVFVDTDPQTWTVDPGLVHDELERRAAAGSLPKAVITVDLYGQSCDHEPILAACERFGVPVVEDAAEALGATYRGARLGRFGAVGVLSFNGNKILTTGGGGMLLSSDPALIDRARHLASQAREPVTHYEHVDLGYNYRLSNLSAAVGRGQLRTLEERIALRRSTAARYRAALSEVPGLCFMPIAPYGEPNGWLTCVTIDPDRFGASRDEVIRKLEARNIEARPVWKPMHLQPLYAGAPTVGGSASEALFAAGLCLPSGSDLSRGACERVISAILDARG